MCGIVACISKRKYGFSDTDKKIFDQLLFVDEVRGDDSTGMFYVNKQGNCYTIKSNERSASFQCLKEYEEMLSDAYMNGLIMVGHNRAATKGSKTDKNAHPFVEDHICLVHNGTLFNHKKIADKDVDSHAIAVGISKNGYKDTLDKIDGAYALIWYNAKEKSLYIARNKERPLWMVENDDAIYIASEDKMLDWVTTRNGAKNLKESTYFATDKIYTWKLDSERTTFYSEKYEKKVVAATTQATKIGVPPVSTTAPTTSTTKSHGQVLVDNIRYGDTIYFTGDTNTVLSENSIKIEGECVDYPKYTARGYVNPLDKANDNVITSDFLVGRAIGVLKKNNKTIIMVDNIYPDWQVSTCDGNVITYSMFTSNPEEQYCHECGAPVDVFDEDGQFWARIKNGKVKHIKCKKCAEKNPNIQKENWE